MRNVWYGDVTRCALKALGDFRSDGGPEEYLPPWNDIPAAA